MNQGTHPADDCTNKHSSADNTFILLNTHHYIMSQSSYVHTMNLCSHFLLAYAECHKNLYVFNVLIWMDDIFIFMYNKKNLRRWMKHLWWFLVSSNITTWCLSICMSMFKNLLFSSCAASSPALHTKQSRTKILMAISFSHWKLKNKIFWLHKFLLYFIYLHIYPCHNTHPALPPYPLINSCALSHYSHIFLHIKRIDCLATAVVFLAVSVCISFIH